MADPVQLRARFEGDMDRMNETLREAFRAGIRIDVSVHRNYPLGRGSDPFVFLSGKFYLEVPEPNTRRRES